MAGVGIEHLVAEVSSLTVIKSAVLQGLGATILPMSCVADEVQQGALRAQEITNPALRSTVALVTRKNALLDRTTASVFSLTVSLTKQLCLDKRWIGSAIAQECKAINV